MTEEGNKKGYGIKHCYVFWVTFVFMMASTNQSGIALYETSMLGPILKAKMGDHVDPSLVSIICMPGIALGSIFGGKIMSINGNRNLNNTPIVLNLLMIIVNSCKFSMNYPLLLVCRFFNGFLGGACNVCFSKFLADTIPNEYVQTYSMLQNTGFNFGILIIGFIQALIIPDQDSDQQVFIEN